MKKPRKKSRLDYMWAIPVACFWFFTAIMVAVLIGYQFVLRAAYKDKEKAMQTAS